MHAFFNFIPCVITPHARFEADARGTEKFLTPCSVVVVITLSDEEDVERYDIKGGNILEGRGNIQINLSLELSWEGKVRA